MQNPTRPTGLRLTIYLGEDKMDAGQPLYKSIVHEARTMRISGVTVIHGTAGYGRSTRLHTSDVLFSEDLPVVVEIVDTESKIDPLIRRLAARTDIGMMTCEAVEILGARGLDDPKPPTG